MVDVGTQCSEPEEAGGQGPADASSPAQQPRHHESFLYADDIVPGMCLVPSTPSKATVFMIQVGHSAVFC